MTTPYVQVDIASPRKKSGTTISELCKERPRVSRKGMKKEMVHNITQQLHETRALVSDCQREVSNDLGRGTENVAQESAILKRLILQRQ
jgi:hypothetical protein